MPNTKLDGIIKKAVNGEPLSEVEILYGFTELSQTILQRNKIISLLELLLTTVLKVGIKAFWELRYETSEYFGKGSKEKVTEALLQCVYTIWDVLELGNEDTLRSIDTVAMEIWPEVVKAIDGGKE